MFDKQRGATTVSLSLFLDAEAKFSVRSVVSSVAIMGECVMAKKSSEMLRDQSKNGDGGAKFLNYDFSEAEKKKFKEWAVRNAEELIGLLDRLIDDGYHLSVKFDSYNQCVGAFIICRDPKSENSGWILTGRGSGVLGAVMGALYRHYVLFEAQWPIEAVSRRANLDDE